MLRISVFVGVFISFFGVGLAGPQSPELHVNEPVLVGDSALLAACGMEESVVDVDARAMSAEQGLDSSYCAQVPEDNYHRLICGGLIDTLNAIQVPAPPTGATKPVYATFLAPSTGHSGEELLTVPRIRRDVVDWLNFFEVLGLSGVYVQIPYPLLTPAWADNHGGADSYMDFYKWVSAEIEARGMKVIINHNTIESAYAHESLADVRAYYDALTPQRFLAEHIAESQWIAAELRPDYLILLTEPTSWEARLGFDFSSNEDCSTCGCSSDYWTAFVAEAVSAVGPLKVEGKPNLGAGSGTWNPYSYYVGRFNFIPGLDFLDLHVYPVVGGLFEALMTWSDMIRSMSSKSIIVSEAGLFKTIGYPPGDAQDAVRVFSRDAREYWEPLDILFLQKLSDMAWAKQFDAISPFWGHMFVTYAHADKPPQELESKDPIGITAAWTERVFEKISEWGQEAADEEEGWNHVVDRMTDSGRAYRDLATGQ